MSSRSGRSGAAHWKVIRSVVTALFGLDYFGTEVQSWAANQNRGLSHIIMKAQQQQRSV